METVLTQHEPPFGLMTRTYEQNQLTLCVNYDPRDIKTSQQKGVFVRNNRAHFFTKKSVRDSQSSLQRAIIDALDKANIKTDDPIFAPKEGANLSVTIQFCFPYPKSISQHQVVSRVNTKRIYKTKKPDIDNISKNTLDALTQLNFWRDDALVTTLCASKMHTLGTPRITITVTQDN